MGRPSRNFRVQYYGLAASIRGHTSHGGSSCCCVGLLERRVRECSSSGDTRDREATVAATASLWNQQGLFGSLTREYYLDYKIRTVNLRLFNTTGPGKTDDAPSDFVRQLARIKKGLQKSVIEVGNLKPRRAFLDVRDTVRGFYLAATKGKPGESYNLCAASTHQIGAMLRTAVRLSGVQAEIRPAAHLMRPSDEKIIFGSTRKFRNDTGWTPAFSLEQTLSSMPRVLGSEIVSRGVRRGRAILSARWVDFVGRRRTRGIGRAFSLRSVH